MEDIRICKSHGKEMSWRISIWRSGLNSNLVLKSFVTKALYLTFGLHGIHTSVYVPESVCSRLYYRYLMSRIFFIWDTRRLWSAIIQFLFKFQLIISILNIITLLRSLSSYLLPAFITAKNVKRSSFRFCVKMIYSADKFFRIQIILKILPLAISLKCTVRNVMKRNVFGMWCGTVWHVCARTHDLHRFRCNVKFSYF
jgi:hypothetical protein